MNVTSPPPTSALGQSLGSAALTQGLTHGQAHGQAHGLAHGLSGATQLANRGALLEAARRAVGAGAGGRVALRLAGVPQASHRRRVLKVLLQDAAQTGGGQVFETTTGEMLLLGTQPTAAARAATALGRLAGSAPLALETWPLPQEAARLMAWVEAATLLPPTGPAHTAPGIAGLDALLANLAPELVLRRRAILRLGSEMALPGRLLELSRPALAAELGAPAEDADLRRHAEDALVRRLLPRLGAPGPLRPQGTLLLPLPVDLIPGPVPRPGLVGVLPLAAAADPDALEERRTAMAEQGWGMAIGGLDAAALRLVAADAIPADWLLLHWSPALAALDPALAPATLRRCLLLGCDSPDALAWGQSRGINRFVGPHVEAVLAAARLAGCREAAGCTQRQCGERAAATASAARTACRNQALLDATLPLPKPPAGAAPGTAAA